MRICTCSWMHTVLMFISFLNFEYIFKIELANIRFFSRLFAIFTFSKQKCNKKRVHLFSNFLYIMIFAAIDIGSNAVRLLFANVFENTSGQIVSSKATFIRIPLRLGEDVFSGGYIREVSIAKLIDTLQAFKQLIAVYDTAAYRVCATAAMREAKNSTEVVNEVFAKTGMKIEVIDGLEEANIIRMAGENMPDHSQNIGMFVDVGGGSTEISVTRNHCFENSYSFQLGTLRLLHNVESKEEWKRLDAWLNEFKNDFGKICLVGSGGNINKLTKLFGDKLDLKMSYAQLSKAYRKMSKMNMEERINAYNLRPDRADVIVPAARLFLHIMEYTNTKQIQVPKFGLADGMVCQLYSEYIANKNS